MPLAANIRATSTAAPSPTIRPMSSSGSGHAPDTRSSSLADSARSRRESTSVPSRSNTYSENGKARRLLGCELGEGRRRLPHFHPHDREALLLLVFEDETRDAFDGRIAVEQKDRIAELSKRRHERIVVSQQHLVIELLVDPAFDHAFDVAEVADHVAIVERSGANLDLG